MDCDEQVMSAGWIHYGLGVVRPYHVTLELASASAW